MVVDTQIENSADTSADNAAGTQPDHTTGEQARETRPPVVLQILPSMHSGGVERGTVEIAAALVNAGWVAVVASAGGSMVTGLERCGAAHITVPSLASKNPIVIRRNIARLAEIIQAHNVDVVHARSRAPAWSAYYAAQQTGRHFVTTFHSAYGRSNFIKRRYNAIMARGETVIANSDFIGDHVRTYYGVGEDRLRVIHRGIDSHYFDPAHVSAERVIKLATDWRIPDGVPVVMMPGRPTRRKGHTVLIESLAELGRDDVLCLLIGGTDGRAAYRRELEKLVTRLNLEGVVRFADNCNDMAAAYMLADVVVTPSLLPEAFGRVAAEAQAMGRPVVATDHGGARETVIDGETGWLVRPGDAGSLARGLKRALDLNTAEREDLAAAARAHVAEKFTVERMTGLTLQVYADLILSGQ